MLGNRNSQHSFAQTPAVHGTRSSFNRSFGVKDTFNFDYLIPCFVDEILPGDDANLRVNMFARLATQKVPIMDNMYMKFYFFFVPNRLVWNNWEKFNGAQDNPDDSTDFLIPTITTTAVTGEPVGSVFDKFGIPTDVPGLEINALPFRAMNLIWNTWFRDQNLQDSLVVSKDDGPDLPSEYALLKINKMHDYFTSMLPWPQKGPAVELPLGTSAPIERMSNAPAWQVFVAGSDTIAANSALSVNTGNTYTSGDVSLYPNGGLYADLSDATAATINQLRQAISIQSLYELDARGGTRYVEILLAHFNVVSPDFRLQRPEYLGGGTTRISSHPVPQTAPTAGSNAQAQLAAFATASASGNIGFTKSFVEHGYVIGFMCAKADLTYQQGLNKLWTRQTRFDFFWPKLQEIGEQAVLTKELLAQGTSADEVVLGYQERFAEYRYKPSEIHGEFRSTFTTPLDQWHLAEELTAPIEFNSDFIESNTPIERALAITSGPDMLCDLFFEYKHARRMLAYSVPSTLGRF